MLVKQYEEIRRKKREPDEVLMHEQYKKISVTKLAIFIRISWLIVSFFAIIKL